MRSATKAQHTFAQVPTANIPRSVFNRSSITKTAFESGMLYPVWCDEALPGDTFNVRMHTFARLATPVTPVLDNMYLDSFCFAVPMRLLWDNWEKFQGAQDDPGDSTSFTIPQLTSTSIEGSLSDYLGIPVGPTGITHSAMWHRAYNLIFNEWFRDENLVDSLVVSTDDGPDTLGDYALKRRGKRHDYFTSCLPWPQKGTAVAIPLGVDAPVTMDTAQTAAASSTGDRIPLFQGVTSGTDVALVGGNLATTWDTTSVGNMEWDDPKLQVDIVGLTGLADLSAATSQTINQLREAFAIQKVLERDARGGTRYTEIVRSHFGVTSPDQRLQRPEYLGGGTQNISATPVPQTSSTDGTSPQGGLTAYWTTQGSNHSFTKSFTEHCVLIWLVMARADINYQQGLPRMFSRLTRYDFYIPALATIGEQSVLNKEIYAQGTDDLTADAATFGYQERWAEYRYKPSMITGEMRSDHSLSLDVWHLAQDFSALPVLNESFIQEVPPVDRVIATPTEPHFKFDAFFDAKVARPMPTFSVPGMIDRF